MISPSLSAPTINPRSRQATSPVLMLTAVRNAGDDIPVELLVRGFNHSCVEQGIGDMLCGRLV